MKAGANRNGSNRTAIKAFCFGVFKYKDSLNRLGGRSTFKFSKPKHFFAIYPHFGFLAPILSLCKD
jgi:hypothetical protein